MADENKGVSDREVVDDSGVLDYFDGPNFFRLQEGDNITVEAEVVDIALVKSKAYDDRDKDDDKAEYRTQLRTYFNYNDKIIPYWSMPNRSKDVTKTEKLLRALNVPEGQKVDIQSLKGRRCKLVLEGRKDKPVKVLSLQRIGGPKAEVQGSCVSCGDPLSTNPKLVVGDKCLACAQEEYNEAMDEIEEDLLGDGEE